MRRVIFNILSPGRSSGYRVCVCVCVCVCLYRVIYVITVAASSFSLLINSQCSTTGVTKAVVCAIMFNTEAGTCARDKHALQQLALNVHVKHSDITLPNSKLITQEATPKPIPGRLQYQNSA